MAFHPDSSNVIYAGTFQGAGTIYKSTDSGATWTAMNTGIAGNNIFEVVIDPLQPNTLFAATQTGGVFVSRNGGGNWDQVNTGLGRLDVRALVIDPVNPATLYASGASGIFKTTNGGQNWQESNNSLTNSVIVKLAIDPGQTNRIYAGAVGTSNVGPWVGGFQPAGSPEPAGGWQWVTGEPFSYANWLAGRPINFNGNNDVIVYFVLGSITTFGKGWADVLQTFLGASYVTEWDEAMCNLIVPTEQSTWGAIKALYD